MKFSVVIPAYNEAELISHTLQAILKQTYTDFEIIVVDNNSSDNTAAIVKTFVERDPRIKLIPCPQQGLLPARNCGLHAATGDVIVQLDADNIPNKNWLKNAARHFRNKKIVALAGPYDYYDAVWWFRIMAILTQYFTLSVGNWYVQKRKFGALMLGGNAFIRKWVLEDIGGYDMHHTFYNEDLVTARAVSKKGALHFYRDLIVHSSARRQKEVGYFALQEKYNKGIFAILTGKPIPNQKEEEYHPR
ncbi:MAG TPA: glycosyltransferase family A protein [Candidatus Paceibacterota bacterium]|jgi:glycosyltransferase involved in cell wall biosynthesis|nr:glycosyltransferase family A protein [Candidatus Paceibacterota bacterium]